MDRFFSGKHRRYLQILADPRDELQRKIILRLLAEEEAEFKRSTPRRKIGRQQTA
jgi:hypothetical protein